MNVKGTPREERFAYAQMAAQIASGFIRRANCNPKTTPFVSTPSAICASNTAEGTSPPSKPPSASPRCAALRATLSPSPWRCSRGPG